MNKSLKSRNKIVTFIFLMMSSFFYGQVDNAPSITADGRQAFCPGSSIRIVTDFTITDIDDTTIDSFFIQISSGYQINFDQLQLSGNHPAIITNWNNTEGKLIFLSSVIGTKMLLTDLENAVKDIVFTTTANNIEEEKFFSLSIGDANYLPLTDHFYQFISADRITWKNAKVAAENRTYYGRQGYLATLINQEEADFAGKQASGPGWIGGSDEETEGEWKWVTGPETGTNFWNGEVNGTTPNFAFWNNNEPNNARGIEDYAHITDPSIGIRGAWNDLPDEGGTGEAYVPKGYIVEYGAPGDPPLKIVASTSIYLPEVLSTTNATICEFGSAKISANSSEGNIIWFDAQTGGNLLFTGNDFTTPVLNSSTTYFATVSVNGCSTIQRLPVTVTVNQRPTVTGITGDLICSGSAILSATTSAGQVYWFASETSTTPLFIGSSFTTPNINNTTVYYAEANNTNCSSIVRTAVTAEVDNRTPDFDVLQETFVLCKNVGSVLLETINSQANYRYIWKKDDVILAGDLSILSVTTSGNYSVKAISEAGCLSNKIDILVRNSEKATFTKENIIITDNSIQILDFNLGIGNYEYAIDNENGVYQDETIIKNLTTGIHTLFIRDKGSCGTEEYKFSILMYPKFFTPNEDGDNDVWRISGFDKTFYTVSDIYIYDRFGKLLHTIDSNSDGWSGTYQNKLLPSNDYWFKTILTDINGYSVEKTGHFSLIRK